MKNVRWLILSITIVLLSWCCGMKDAGEQKSDFEIEAGTYKAVINPVNMDESLRVYAEVSEVFFSFEPDQTFLYQVRAMGNEMDDVGKWEIRGDSMYIFDLGRGPNTAFKMNEVGEGQFELIGPNHFVLSKTEEQVAPIDND